jgi:nucleoid-associated protein YgaU
MAVEVKLRPFGWRDEVRRERAVAAERAKRRLAFWARVGAAVLIAMLIAACYGAKARQVVPTVLKEVTVRPGDSLWTIARQHGDPQTYILQRMEDIARVNSLEDAAILHPGERLLIPITP